MAQALRHADHHALGYRADDYKILETIRVGNRRGLVLQKTSSANGRRVRHTVLLGKSFHGDDNTGGAARKLDDSESKTLAKKSFVSNTNKSAPACFLLNAQSKSDAANDPGDMDDDRSEMYGTVPVSCTCEDWKWRGVKHKLARGSVGRTSTKNNRLDTFYRRYCSKSVTKHYNTDSTLAASESGCRHMVWVSRTWRRRTGKVPRARRLPARFRDT